MDTGVEMKYFILKPKSRHADDKYAQASRHAMKTYSEFICTENPALSKGLYDWQKREQDIEDAKRYSEELPKHWTLSWSK